MSRALVTGAAGFAGRYLVDLLLRETPWQVDALVHHGGEALARLPADGRLRVLPVDLLDAEATARVIERSRPDRVYHLAAQTFVPASFDDPAATLTGNVLMQLHVLEAIRRAELMPRVLIVGSNEEYGAIRPEELPVREETPFRPTSPYAVSKIAQDMLGLQYFETYRLPVVRVRAFNHTGPGQSSRFVASAFARQVAEIEAGLREPVVKVGNLEARRDFTDVRDVVRAYHLALEKGAAGEVYNVGSGRSVPVQHILDWLVEASRVAVEVRLDPARLRPADVPEVRADTARLRAATGWEPRIPLETTVLELLDWWRAEVARRPA